MKQYTTITKLEDYILLDIDTEFEPSVQNWIEAVSEQIDLITNREWLTTGTPTARVFDGNGRTNLYIPENVNVSQVEIRYSTDDIFEVVDANDYVVSPYNDTPYNQVILLKECFPKGIQTVRITADWGYDPVLPEDIVFACTVMVAGIVNEQTNQEGEVESEKIGNYTVKYTTNSQKKDYQSAMDILQRRKVIVI